MRTLPSPMATLRRLTLTLTHHHHTRRRLLTVCTRSRPVPDLDISRPITQSKPARRRSSDSDSDSKVQFTLQHTFGDSDFTTAGVFTARLKSWPHGGQYVMVVLKGSLPITFGGSEQPAAYGELVSIGGLNLETNKKLSAAVASILHTKLSIPKN